MSIWVILALLAGMVIGVAFTVALSFIVGAISIGTINIQTIDQKRLYALDIKNLDKLDNSKVAVFKVNISEYQDEDA